jgi:phosphate transport system permease protein
VENQAAVDVIVAAARVLTNKKPRWLEEGIRWLLFACAFLSIAVTAAIIFILVKETYVFFTTPLGSNVGEGVGVARVSVTEFLTGTKWAPILKPQHFGVLPLVCGTLLVMVGSAAISLPLGLAGAIYLSEYASDRMRSFIKPVLEILAGVPTVVYGYFALTLITPLLQALLNPPMKAIFGPHSGVMIFNAASAAVVVGIMTLPMVTSLCDDAFRAVPDTLRQGGFAMGATRYEVATQVLLPAALSGVFASFILAVSRAIGETMAVTLAAGGSPKLTLNPFTSVQTMTAYIVQVSLGDTPAGGVEYQTIFAVGALLFVLTLGLNVVAHKIVRRFKEVYE